MAQNPLQPRDSGEIGMPKVFPGMNRIAPTRLQGNKGQKEGMLGSKADGKKSVDELLARMRKRMEKAVSSESENRQAGLDDLNFLAGKQWPSEIAAQRNLDKRPCHTINKLPVFVNQVVNPLREDRPTINISPVGDKSDVEVAKMYRGLIRAIERDCFADIAYDHGLENAVGAPGWGYWRLRLEYDGPRSFNQVIVVERIMNPFTVYLDPSCKFPEGSDAKWGFITSMMPRSEYEADYPDSDVMSYQQTAQGDSLKDWIGKDEVRIAEYFECKTEKRTLVALDNGHIGWEDELDEITLARIQRGSVQIEDEREADYETWKHYKVNAVEILEETEWPGRWIPIVRCVGNEIDVEGKIKLSGIVRNAKDSQRMYNYWRTLETELIALQPKAPWILEEGQVEGHEDEWKMANIRSNPYLLYKGTSIAGKQAPQPQRQPFVGAPQGVEAALQGAAQDMMATTGIRFDATLAERTYDESGKALRELRRSGDIGSAHYGLNYGRALRHTGEMFVDLIPKIYDVKRVATILREDDSEEQVTIDPHLNKPMERRMGSDNKVMRVFNPNYGKYGVTVTIGPSYATKRIEAAENMMAFARAMPQTAGLFADLIAKNMDWPGAEEIAARIAKTLPPGLLTPDQKDMSPQIQALIQSMDQQIAQLGQQLQQAVMALNEKNTDRQIAIDKINKDFEVKLLGVVMQMETKMAKVQQDSVNNFNTHIGAQLKELGTGMTTLVQSIEKGAPKPEKMAEVDGAAQAKMADRMGQMHEAITTMHKDLKKPKKIKISRGKDGLATEATVSQD